MQTAAATMYRIQEVVHKFRSGGTEKKDGNGGGGALPQASGVTATGQTSLSSSPAPEENRREKSKWYMESTVKLSTNLPLSEKAELSSLPIITPAGLHQTMLSSLAQTDLLSSSLSATSDSSSGLPPPTSPDKKLTKTQPKGTMDYKVLRNDTLEKIAAHFDVTPSELKKLNRMTSRMVFENQVLYIPDPEYVPSEPATPEHISPPHSPVDVRPKIDIPIVKMVDKPPPKVPGHVMKIPSVHTSTASSKGNQIGTLPRALSEDEARKLDEECYERFIKVCAQHISDGFEKIPGTLLVTPNAIMFDPYILDDRVIEQGSEQFGVVVYMDTVLSAALYHDVSAITYLAGIGSEGDSLEKPEIYYGDTRARSASTSSVSISKSAVSASASLSHSVVTSKSMSGLELSDKSHEIMKGGSDSCGKAAAATSGLSPFFADPQRDTTDGASCTGRRNNGDIKVVGSVLHADSGGDQVDVGQVAGETNTDDVPTSLMTFDLDSFVNNQITMSSKYGTVGCQNSSMQSKEGSSVVVQSLQGWDNKAEDGDAQTLDPTGEKALDEADISALLAGGRRDSMKALDSTSGDNGIANFYPPETAWTGQSGEGAENVLTSPHDVGEGENSDAIYKKCADKLVSDILESVTKDTRQRFMDSLQSESAVSLCASTKEDDLEILTGKSVTGGDAEHSMMMTTGSSNDGEVRIGNIVYLPVKKSSDGEMVIQAANNVSGDTSDSSKTSSGMKTKPGPLANLGIDAVDCSSPSLGDGLRSRPSSESFSPLRSSAQHISNFVNYATGFFRSSNDDRASVKDTHDIPVVRERSSTVPAERTKMSVASEAMRNLECRIKNAVKAEERPELFQQITDDDLIPHHEDVHRQPAIYLHLRVNKAECDRRVTTSTPSETYRYQTTRPHYWFSIPRDKADHLYAFFVQWRPELYREDDISVEDRGFVVVDSRNVGESAHPLPFIDNYYGSLGSSFRKDWEIVSREELKRRESEALDIDQVTMPELSQDSSIMGEDHLMALSESLPARTIGYKWTLAYSTSMHGFSLKRLYREVGQMDSPILLVLQDTQDMIFGAYLSDPPKLSDHFYGTGTCQLWTFKNKFQSFGWSGENAFFIKGDDSSLSVGASLGVYGLWLDSDLYHGRSRQCATFNNMVLSDQEDFIIRALEAWAFVTY